MSEQVGFELNLDATGFDQGAEVITRSAGEVTAALAAVVLSAGGVGKALRSVTPSKAALGGFAVLAASAASNQQNLSGLAATSKVTGQSFGTLSKQVSQLARQFPIGNRAALEVVQSLQAVGKTGKGTEAQIATLSKTFVQLQGATGEAGVGRNLAQLSKSLGNTNLDPDRFRKTADAVTQLSKSSGAGANNIIQFSKAIAPIGRSAGLSTTAVLGISTAFSKLGEDGLGAATAVNKMLGDLNSAARDGGDAMGVYANIVGKTRKEFEALFKASPVEALTQVTEAIGSSGGRGQRQLESIGIEGVRGQRALQALAQGGGLRGSIRDAQRAYGNDSTRQASEAAFGGLNDSLNRLQTSSEQVANAFGQPLLGPLTAFTNLLGKVSAGSARVGQNSGVQAIGSGLAWAAAGVLVAKAFVKALATPALARFLLTAAPVRALANGITNGPNAGNRTGYFGRMLDRYTDPIRKGVEANSLPSASRAINEKVQAARDRRDARLQQMGVQPKAPGGPGAIRQILGMSMLAATQAQAIAQDTTRGAATGNRANPNYRETYRFKDGTAGREFMDSMRPKAAEARRARQMGMDANPAAAAERAKLGDAFRKLSRETGAATTKLGLLSKAAGIAVMPVAATAKFAGAEALRGVRGAARAGMSAIGAPMLALGAVGTIASFGRNQMQQTKETFSRSTEIRGTLEAYREAVGLATENTTTMADQIQGAGKALTKSVKTYSRAAEVTERDLGQAQSDKSGPLRTFSRDIAQAIEQVNGINSNGLSPQEMQAVKMDMLNGGRSESFVEQVLAGANRQTGGTETFAERQARMSAGPDRQQIAGQVGGAVDVMNQATRFDRVKGFFGGTTKEGANAVKAISEALGQKFESQKSTFGADFAQQELFKGAQAAYEEAVRQGDPRQAYKIVKQLQTDLGLKGDLKYASQKDTDKTLVDRLVGDNEKNRAIIEGYAQRGIDTTAKGEGLSGEGIDPKAQRSLAAQQMGRFGAFGSFFNNIGSDSDRSTNRQVASFLEGDESVTNRRDTVNAVIKDAQAAGQSLGELARVSQKAAVTAEYANSQQAKLAAAVARTAQVMLQIQAPFQNPGQSFATNLQNSASIATSKPSTEEGETARQQSLQDVGSQLGQVQEQQKAYLQQIREVQKQRRRTQEDYNQQIEYAEYDFNLNMQRQAEAAGRQRARSEEDYALQRSRSIEDFNLSVLYQERDFFKQRQRSQADFTRSMKRLMEDATDAVYSPFERIKVQQAWDLQGLVANLEQQNQAMAKQVANLEKIRKMGISQQAIDQLGLTKTEQAQQLALIVDNATMNPDLVRQLNEAAKKRGDLSGGLAMDDKNVRRQQEDFARANKQQMDDFIEQQRRGREAFDKSMARSAQEFTKGLRRMAEDLAIAQAQAVKDFNEMQARQLKAYNLSMARMEEDVADSQKTIFGTFEELSRMTLDAMNGKTVEFRDNLTTTLRFMIDEINRMSPELRAAVEQLGLQGFPTGTSGGGGGGAGSQTSGGGTSTRGGVVEGGGGGGSGKGPVKYGVVQGVVTSGYGPRKPPKKGASKHHNGVDIGAAMGSPVYAYMAGEVVMASKNNGGYGTMVAIDHGAGRVTRYAHLSKMSVRSGTKVKDGAKIGEVGMTGTATGPHLHFEKKQNGKFVDPDKAAFAKGGIATRATEALIGEAGSREAVIPLNAGGVGVLAKAMGQYISDRESRTMIAGQGRTYITHNTTHMTDMSTRITGPITVHAEDPNELMMKIAAKQRRDNLTRTPTRKGTG